MCWTESSACLFNSLRGIFARLSAESLVKAIHLHGFHAVAGEFEIIKIGFAQLLLTCSAWDAVFQLPTYSQPILHQYICSCTSGLFLKACSYLRDASDSYVLLYSERVSNYLTQLPNFRVAQWTMHHDFCIVKVPDSPLKPFSYRMTATYQNTLTFKHSLKR